jgi:outer membrane protein OmpA-like peptidoglycan-associated protein
VNIGYPINTHKDDFGLIVNARGNLAMFSSSRPGSRDWDIFQFDLYEAARPTPVTYLTGKVFDAITGKPLGGEVELINIHSNENVSYLQADIQTGHYLTCLPVGNDYALNVARKGYLFYSENFSLQEVHEVSKPYVLNVPLQPIREGAIIVLRNIFFGTDSANLRPESVAELQKLLQLLETNPGLCIEIGGHTDNVGSNDYNLKLSDMRARAVFDYLIKNGIKASRLSYKGYSFSVPLADNNTEEGRALNRRTEVKVTAVK